MAKKYSKAKLNKFRKTILAKMEEVSLDMDDIKSDIMDKGNPKAGLSQDSVYSVHMADAGSDSFEQEKNFMFMSRESDYYKNLSLALERINNEEFGVCDICGGLIVEERLMEVPNATKCVECKTKDKLNLK
ncbi:MAG TPA: transcriptional regulator [Candidatus Marinimicrobia bacterium]|nr:TraR/DksA C4-type zinc finger protein [Candidatus Neomarinimicrobiota bacterium]MDP6229476.1 TraR/DksA C4-type zinc finger protein [Candidatus Neomarinimicrobiota bacterium]HBR86944.1 transcriptional regulator [Candidatus Neomarinimicrobiota bacterium]